MVSVAQFVPADVALGRLTSLAEPQPEWSAPVHYEAYKRQSLSKGADLGLNEPALILAGWACQHTEMANGVLRSVGFLLPGDVIDASFVGAAPGRHVRAVTPVYIARHDELSSLLKPAHSSGLYRALHLLDEARRLDHIVRLSTLHAYEALAHLFMEFHDRMDSVGLVSDGRFGMPLSQKNLGRFLGISAVHVNRTLHQLMEDKMAWTGPGWAALADPARIAERVGCSSSYRHLTANPNASADERSMKPARPAYNGLEQFQHS